MPRPVVGGGTSADRSVLYCVVPRDLADRLLEPLRAHFADDPGVRVVAERRQLDRRTGGERRSAHTGHERVAVPERRTIRYASGRRAADRRALAIAASAMPDLPRRARRYAERLTFLERLEPPVIAVEDATAARLVTRYQAGEEEVFGELYLMYFDRVFNYLRVVLKDSHEAEDATQQVFVRVFQSLPRYELRPGRPFRAWLFTVVRNHALTEMKKLGRFEATEPSAVDRARDLGAAAAPELPGLEWITDRELMMFVERLPLAQRQVLLLRFMLDLTDSQIAAVLGRSTSNVRALQSRAQRYLRDRLAAVGRESAQCRRSEWKRRGREARVLRLRRFALSP